MVSLYSIAKKTFVIDFYSLRTMYKKGKINYYDLYIR